MIEERGQLKEDLSCLQAERDTLFEEKLQMEADLRSCLGSRLQQRAEMERIHASYLQMEAVAHTLQRQSEVLSGRVHTHTHTHTLTVMLLCPSSQSSHDSQLLVPGRCVTHCK